MRNLQEKVSALTPWHLFKQPESVASPSMGPSEATSVMGTPRIDGLTSQQVTPQMTPQKNPTTTPQKNADTVQSMIERLSQCWSQRAGVKTWDSSGQDLPLFEEDKDDFLESLLPFYEHVHYQALPSETKQKILTCAWILYNLKTIAIETEVVTPACTLIVNDETFGLTDLKLKKLAAETMTDEAFHTALVLEGICISENKRGVHLQKPKFNLVSFLQEEQSHYPEPWKKSLILLTTAIVSEIFISDYLTVLRNAETVQPINRRITETHFRDELNHGKIFKVIAKALYSHLSEEQRAFFKEILHKPIHWFANKDIEVWGVILKNLGVDSKNADQMVTDCLANNAAYLKKIDYRGIEELAKELEITEFHVTPPTEAMDAEACEFRL